MSSRIVRRLLTVAVFEYTCHEGTYALQNLITGSQADRAKAAAAATT